MSKLYLVPTPVGNLEDMTLRAIRVLKEADLVLAEDTRVSAKLMKHYDISTPMTSHHKFNEHAQVQKVVEKLKNGTTIALVSDAGTPGVSDPGFLLCREAIREGIEVECLPGATAFVPALVGSGLAMDRFVFEGFLPVKKGRQSRLNALKEEERTIVFYESPYKLERTLTDLAEAFGGERQGVVAREISKIHEQYVRGSLEEIRQHFQKNPPRGEIVLLVEGSDRGHKKEKKKQTYE